MSIMTSFAFQVVLLMAARGQDKSSIYKKDMTKSNFSCQFTLRSAVFGRTRIWSGVFWLRWLSVEVRLNQHPRASEGPSPQVLTLLAPEMSFFRGMRTRSEAFLEPPGASGLWCCVRTHVKKGLVPYTFVWWCVRQIPPSIRFRLKQLEAR